MGQAASCGLRFPPSSDRCSGVWLFRMFGTAGLGDGLFPFPVMAWAFATLVLIFLLLVVVREVFGCDIITPRVLGVRGSEGSAH